MMPRCLQPCSKAPRLAKEVDSCFERSLRPDSCEVLAMEELELASEAWPLQDTGTLVAWSSESS